MEAALSRPRQALATIAILTVSAVSAGAQDRFDRLAVESLLIRAGFSGATVDRAGAVWQGEGARNGRLLHFVVEASRIRILDSREGGDGPIDEGR